MLHATWTTSGLGDNQPQGLIESFECLAVTLFPKVLFPVERNTKQAG